MNQQNTKSLFENFAFFRPDKSLQETLMSFGFECGDGWFDLIYKLCEDLADMELPMDFEVIQVKEKFGGLRFYINGATEDVFDRINKAEEESYTICENCGEPSEGPERTKGWVSTLCETCKAKSN
ncbi:MAG: hypothetical protein LC687_01425 [Actinobacteria bacterium]|nr:hypothetical protein [Actinomycetota bacterium]